MGASKHNLLIDTVYRAAFRQPGDSALGVDGGGSAPTQEIFWKHPSKTNIPDNRSTNPDESLIGKMIFFWVAMEF